MTVKISNQIMQATLGAEAGAGAGGVEYKTDNNNDTLLTESTSYRAMHKMDGGGEKPNCVSSNLLKSE